MPRPFDWRALLVEKGIPFVERGPNVKRGEINIRCPFCGTADPSHHMGLNLDNGFWACWRNGNHRGKSPVRLLVQLLQIPYGHARRLAGLDNTEPDPEGFDAMAARFLGRNKAVRMEEVRREFLSFPREFEEISDRIRTRKFWNYLYKRGFGFNDVDKLCHEYSIRCARSGRWADRVIFPYYQDGELVAWTGRDITGTSTRRYLALSYEDCLIPPKETLFNFDCVKAGGMALIVAEGPLDVLKLDYYGKPYGIRAVGLSTSSITEQQTFLLQEARDQFEHKFVMLDTETSLGLVHSMNMKADLATLGTVRAIPVPYGAKDAGSLDADQMRRWVSRFNPANPTR